MSRYVNPFTDLGFKIIFKEEDLKAKFRTDTVLSDQDTGKVVSISAKFICSSPTSPKS